MPANKKSALCPSAVTPLLSVTVEPGGIRCAPGVRAGKLQILVTTSPAGARFLPGIPSIAQAGLPGYEGDDWFGVFAPAATPLTIRAKVSREIARILALPEMRERLNTLGAEPVSSAPAPFETMVRDYIVAMRKLGDEVGIKAE